MLEWVLDFIDWDAWWNWGRKEDQKKEDQKKRERERDGSPDA